ncbi:MAG: ferritin-like domain-containing protein [Myxococcota bacterium]
MDKILSEHRKQIGDFEVIDFEDEAIVQGMRSRVDVDVPVDLHWTWSYESEIHELRRLYEKGKRGQWNAQTDLDWDIPVDRNEWMMTPEMSLMANVVALHGGSEAAQKEATHDEIAYTLSQLLHGEQAALQLCGQLTNVCTEIDQKFYAASQVIDEARHAEVLSKYLGEKVGEIHPIGGDLKTLLEILLQAQGMQKKVLGMQTLFEGMAVGIMDTIRRESRNALLSTMLHRVEQDESRHAAFGVLNMRRIVKQVSRDEMEEMEDWAFSILETLNANQQLEMLRRFADKYGYDPEGVVAAATKLPNFAELNSPIYMHTVVPNLRNLGLITERTEDHWKRVGMIYDASEAAVAS